jgi:hypothetical protein
VDEHPKTRVGMRTWVIVIGSAILAFLLTRLVVLDRDLPPWSLAQYSPIDEFTYVLPAFNLHHDGTWTHQIAPWAQVEGWPMNVAQTALAALSLELGGYTYIGLRVGSVLFACVAFLALLDIVRRRAIASVDGGLRRSSAIAIVAACAVLLVLDFSFLVAGRTIEPTIARLAGIAALLWLVQRGTLLGQDHALRRSAALGAVVAGLVWFVYVYNAFMVPAAIIALVAWAWAGGPGTVARHLAAFAAGAVLVTGLYFAGILLVYGHSPVEWFRTWIVYYDDSSRVAGAAARNLWSILEANIFRLDRPLLLLFLLSIPVFLWRTVRTRQPASILIVGGLGMLLLQSVFVADYPIRKFLILLVFVVPIVADGIMHADAYLAWARRDHARRLMSLAWGALAVFVVVSLLLPPGVAPWLRLYDLVGEPRLDATGYQRGILGPILTVAGAIGVAAIIAAIGLHHRKARLAAGLAVLVAISVPLAYVDRTFVLARPSYTYRDSLIAVDGVVGDQPTAGGWSVGMQLYNRSRAALSGYHYGQEREAYRQDVVRAFQEGLATSMFDYTDATTRAGWESLGFVLMETYPILLPREQVLGRYRFEP